MTRHLLLLMAALFVALLPAAAGAAEAERPVVILVDISRWMADDDGTGRIKMDGAKAALLSFIRNIDRDVPVGLRTYPDPHGGQCNGGTVQSPIVAGSPQRLASLVRNLEPDGNTPTAEALLAAEEQLLNSPYREVGATIVLVSDGESNCAPPLRDCGRDPRPRRRH